MSVKRITFVFLIVCALVTTAAAQEISSVPAQSSSLTITAAANGERVRITAPSSVVQLHLEIYATGGEKLFDQEIRGGNVFDWHLQNGQGQRVAPGSYVCVVTVKSVSGRITQKIGAVKIGEKEASVEPATSAQLSPAQAQTIGPVEDNSSWKITGKEEPPTSTVIAHDGADGQMIRGRGALTFRIGNFFTGNDREQMRLTEDGRLGIGTNDPRATLDVAGTIRAQRFLIVKPKTAEAGKSAQEYLTSNATEPGELLLTGSGTQDRIAKWLDNAGTLGDSTITETGGNVGIGTTTPGSKLVVSSNSATLPAASGIARFADADGVQTAIFADAWGTNPLFNVRRANGTAAAPSAVLANQLLGVIGASGYGASAYVGTRARIGFFASENWTNTANGTYLTFNTTANGAATAGGTERLRIDNAGNVGIGMTADPAIKLDVSGSTRITPGNGYSISFGSPNAETGMTLLKPGISRADVRFNGTTLSLFASVGVVPPCCGITVHTSGKVGIANTNPTAGRLHVTGGTNNGVYGDTVNVDGVGVYGAHASTGVGVLGTSSGGVGVKGDSGNDLGTGVAGVSVNGFGVTGYSPGGKGVEGTSTVGIGVSGKNTGQNPGVYGESPYVGVFGKGTAGVGVYGESNSNTGDNSAVYGHNTAGGFSGYFTGKVQVNGLLSVGGGCNGCSPPSDRNLKANFSAVNQRLILDRLATIPIQSWNYKTELDSVRHIGAMAQDFRAAFGLGKDDTTLNTVDANGVTMAAVQALYQMMLEKDKEIERLQARLRQVERRVNGRRN